MGAALLISDLHLSEATPSIEAGLSHFLNREILQHSQRIEQLFILGDFFEAWVGDDDDAPYIERVKSLLRQVVASGTSVYLARGNRDFLLGQPFASSIGATMLNDATVVNIAGLTALLMHGDSLCTDDVDYQAFRVMAHNPDWQRETLAKPLAERKALAQQLRAMSIDAASNKAEDIMDVNADTVDAVMRQHAVNWLIHGHTHRPARHSVPAGERVVLGDWSETHGWCARISRGDLTLERFAF